jgi:hypothetical protein
VQNPNSEKQTGTRARKESMKITLVLRNEVSMAMSLWMKDIPIGNA